MSFDDLELLRAFEPVVRLTKGEEFVPVSVDAFVQHSALWRRTASDSEEMLVEPGGLDLDLLAEAGVEAGVQPRAISAVHTGEPGRWRDRWHDRGDRERLVGGNRLAAVGVLSRLIDLAIRLSLLFRGSVPGGTAARARVVQRTHLNSERPTYYGRVVRDGGYVVCQYWFFYAFNNWRSGFGGINEHEADWEQVTVYLDGTGDTDDRGFPAPRWVAFSAHDETGDDLRRRWDDPDLTLLDGSHPVVFAGAGSHSGAYLPGDYLITVQSPRLARILGPARDALRLLTPWSPAATGVGIPYVDYARGDGLAIGPGEEFGWNPVVIDDSTGWVVEFRGLWGYDTGDRFGGERGPAGPRYERDGRVRASWGDPVGWAGLNKVLPGPGLHRSALEARVVAIDHELEELDAKISAGRGQLRTLVSGLGPDAGGWSDVAQRDRDLQEWRRRVVELRDERHGDLRTLERGPVQVDPHAHLHRRNTPMEPADRTRQRVLGFWAVISTPLVLALLSWLVVPLGTDRTTVAIVGFALAFGVEALARGYLLAFLWRVVIGVGVGFTVFFLLQDWQIVTAGLLALLAVVMMFVNTRDAIRR